MQIYAISTFVSFHGFQWFIRRWYPNRLDGTYMNSFATIETCFQCYLPLMQFFDTEAHKFSLHTQVAKPWDDKYEEEEQRWD